MNVVITGASSGIGRELARIFARKGHAVLAVARREERIQALCQEMARELAGPAYPGSPGVTCLAQDLTCPGAAQKVFEAAVRTFGKVHGLINAAGMSPYQEFREVKSGHLSQTLALNIQSLTELCAVFLPHMLAHGEPCHLVNVGSVGGYAPLPRFAVYTGSKHYVRAFTNMLYRECRKTNVRVSALHPGGTLTEFQVLAGQRLKPLARLATMTPEQVAQAAYPAILKGKRVIVPGGMNQLMVLLGKVLPFPWAIRMTEFVYDLSIEPTEPTYPL
jgi:uncharacterized protein